MADIHSLQNGTKTSSGFAGTLNRRGPLLLALATVLLASGATFGAWNMASQERMRNALTEFDVQVRQTVRRIEERMATYEQVERGTQAFLLGSIQVRQDDFRLFVDTLRLNEKFPGIQGIALVELVPATSPARLTGDVRRDDMPGKAHPAGVRPLYSSITRIEPFTGLNLRALGFDMLTDPTRRVAMERARDTGEAAASGKVRLIQENGKDEQAGLVMYLPVYRRGTPVASVAQRRANLIGWVGVPFRMDDLMAGLGGERSRELILSIFDGESVEDKARLYRSASAASLENRHQSLFKATRRMVIAGRPWTLDLRSAELFESRQQSDKPRLVAGIGGAASVLLAWMVWSLATARRRALSLATDVTQQLSESEFRWKYALEGAGDGVWDWNRATGILYSKRWKEMLGYSEHEILNTTDQWERLIHPDDAPSVRATLRAYLDSPFLTYEAEYRMRCKDGSWKWILARAMAVTRDSSGRPLRTIGTHADISRSKHDEQALRDANARLASEQHRVKVMLEHSHDAFIAVAPNGRVTDWSTKAENLLGWTAGAAVGSDLATLIVPPELRSAHNAGFQRFVQSGQGAFIRNVIEVNALHQDGRLIPVELAIAGFPEASGYAVSAFIRDISERKRAQRVEAERTLALEEARSALQHAQKLEAVGKLTGGIAHDFNNVLHVIGGNVQLLQRLVGEDARFQQRLRSMQSAVDKGAKLSSQLLAFARRQPLQPVVVNLLRTVTNMDDLLQRALGESVRIRIDADQALWHALVDPGQLENVILNLALNARDAMPDGGTLTIGLHNTELGPDAVRALVDMRPGHYIRLTVADTGSGMSEEIRAVAFEPFFTTKPVGQGTGLGLSMAYGFVKQSGGHIQLTSAPGAGTTVVIYLPKSDGRETRLAAPRAEAAVGGDETILVVEDDPEVRITAVSTLVELGYRVLDAPDGERALAMVRGGAKIDLLFTDVVMPGPVSSTELAARAREILPGIAVLFTSGYTRNALVTDGQLDEGVQLLSKPYRGTQLAQKVRDMLHAA